MLHKLAMLFQKSLEVKELKYGREWGADEISQDSDAVLREAFILHKSQDFIVSHVPRISRIFQSMKVIWLPQLTGTLINVTMKACENCVDILNE